MPQTPTTSEFTAEQLVSASLMRLGGSDRNPFFASLAMMAPVIITDDIETAATDGERLYFNADFLRSLQPAERDGLLVHEVLHAALLHVTRCGEREPRLWNIACDIVVNGMVVEDARLELPKGGLRDKQLEHLPVEEVYDLLLMHGACGQGVPILRDLRPDLGDHARDGAHDSQRHGTTCTTGKGDAISDDRRRRIERTWHIATSRAACIAQQRGTMPAGVERHFGRLLAPQVNWRTRLWQFMARTPDDFSGFDRRHLWAGLYLEELQDESVWVDVCIDTSGSISPDMLTAFMGELRGIVAAYRLVRVRVYFCDTQCHGPFPLTKADEPLPIPRGGGGTSFEPFFETVRRNPPQGDPGLRVLVYLTDGEGTFPDRKPDLPCLWVVTPGGLLESRFPFGEVIRMS